jgi:hypothetical protein
MKHEILEEVWRIRDEISSECGHDVKKLAEMLRRKEGQYGERLARLPVVRRPARPAAPALREEPPKYERESGGNS